MVDTQQTETATFSSNAQKIPADTPLEHKYQVWAMVKQTRQQ